MINTVILVGRLITSPEPIPTRDQIPTKWNKFILGVERPFKNRQNEYEIDYITIKTWVNNCEEFKDLLLPDTIIGLKGRIQTFSNKNNDFHYTEIIADKIIYLE